METSGRKWESGRQMGASGRRTMSRRRSGVKASLGPREKRRLAQLVICICLFLVVFLGKDVFPERIEEVRICLTETIQADTDLKAAFSSLGRSISEGEPVMETLGELWVDVFGAGETVEVSAPNTPGYLAQAAFLAGFPQAKTAPEHWLSILGEPKQVEEPAAVEPEPEATSAPTPKPVVEHMPYDGPILPTNATKDKYDLSAFGVGETVTPALGWVSSNFGWREHPVDGGEKFHNGVDLAVNDGTDVLAFADGTVDYIGDSPIYGLYLQLDHGNGVKTFYAHCSDLFVHQGDTVQMGQRVAASGDTGNSTGPHLHFEIKLNGVLLDPLYYIKTA